MAGRTGQGSSGSAMHTLDRPRSCIWILVKPGKGKQPGMQSGWLSGCVN